MDERWFTAALLFELQRSDMSEERDQESVGNPIGAITLMLFRAPPGSELDVAQALAKRRSRTGPIGEWMRTFARVIDVQDASPNDRIVDGADLGSVVLSEENLQILKSRTSTIRAPGVSETALRSLNEPFHLRAGVTVERARPTTP